MEKDIQSLNQKFAIPQIATFSLGNGQLPRLNLTTQHANLEIYLQGATLTNYQPHQQKPILFTSPKSNYQPHKAIRGGIPICFPWFAQNNQNKDLPMHGLARTATFTPLDITPHQDQSITATFQLKSSPATLKIWPHPFLLKYQITLADALQIEITATNTGSQPFHFEQALHTYFHISNLNDVQILGLENTHYIDKTDQFKQKQFPAKPLKIDGFTDAVCLDTPASCRILDPAFNRQINIEKNNSQSTIIWNPHQDHIKNMSDLNDHAWSHFLCIESANVDKNRIHLPPQASHTMTLNIHAQNLP